MEMGESWGGDKFRKPLYCTPYDPIVVGNVEKAKSLRDIEVPKDSSKLS